MLVKLNEIKNQLADVNDYATLNRLFDRVEMLVRNCSFGDDAKKSYAEKIGKLELSKMAAQEVLMPNYPLLRKSFEKSKEDAAALLDVIIEDETINQI